MHSDAEAGPIACNPSAIPNRPRYNWLRERLRFALSRCAELPHGYSYSVPADQLSLTEIGEWISLERLCCPFLRFELSVSGTETLYWLTLTGPGGVKTILEREFPDQHNR